MNLQIESGFVEVQPRVLVRMHVEPGLRITGVSGTSWVTVDGDPEDLILEPGDTHAFKHGGRALVQALGGPSQFTREDGIVVES